MNQARTKVGNADIKVNPDILSVLRKRVFAVKPQFKINRPKKPTNYTAMAKAIACEFPTLGLSLVEAYACVVGEVPDDVFKLFLDGKFSTGVLKEIGQADLSPGYKNKLALKAVDPGLTTSQIRQIKSLKKKHGDNIGIAELVQRVTGVIDPGDDPEALKEVSDTFCETVNSVMKNGAMYASSIEMAIDTLPGSVLAGGVNYLKVYDQIRNLTVELERTLPFLKQKKREILLQIKDHVITELQIQPKPEFEEIRDVEGTVVEPKQDIGGS